jgi:hypothetical protein
MFFYADYHAEAWAKNAFEAMQIRIFKKMHALVCLLLGFVALHGLANGHLTRFELEFMFLTLAGIVSVILSNLPPGFPMTLVALKPETWLQIVLWYNYWHVVRPSVLIVCAGFNLYGVVFYLVKGRTVWETYEQMRADVVSSEGEEQALKMDVLAWYNADSAEDGREGGKNEILSGAEGGSTNETTKLVQATNRRYDNADDGDGQRGDAEEREEVAALMEEEV